MEQTITTKMPSLETPPREEEFEVVIRNKLSFITSSSTSPHRHLILLTTLQGFIIVNPPVSLFTRYQHKQSPFFKGESVPFGIQLGSVIQKRTEVSLVPNFSSRHFCSTSVYIYDYSIGIILGTFDFVLPILQLSLTDRYLLSSNNKRLVLYDYLRGGLKGGQAAYIEAFKQGGPNDYIRYLPLECHLYSPISNNQKVCECGQYSLTRIAKYLKIYYIRISPIQNTKSKTLYCYDEATDRTEPFEGISTLSEDFQFTVTEDGKYLGIIEDHGRRIKIYNLPQNVLQTVLHVSRDPRPILHFGVITLPDKSQWVVASREKENDEATMHLFKLGKTPLTQHIQSNYKRYFRLYKQFSLNQGTFAHGKTFLAPQYYLHGEKLFCLALEGEFCQLIDLSRAGLHERVRIKDYRRLQETNRLQQ